MGWLHERTAHFYVTSKRRSAVKEGPTRLFTLNANESRREREERTREQRTKAENERRDREQRTRAEIECREKKQRPRAENVPRFQRLFGSSNRTRASSSGAGSSKEQKMNNHGGAQVNGAASCGIASSSHQKMKDQGHAQVEWGRMMKVSSSNPPPFPEPQPTPPRRKSNKAWRPCMIG